MRVLVSGDREWTDRNAIRRELKALLPNISCIIHGAARGADLLAEDVAWELQIDYQGFPAKWKKHGRAAGPIRNKQMLVEGKPDFLLAFHANIEGSKGTADMIKQATKAGIPYKLIIK